MMVIDPEFALIELTATEAQKFALNEAYAVKVRKTAQDLSDETARTVEIRRVDGFLIETVTNY